MATPSSPRSLSTASDPASSHINTSPPVDTRSPTQSAPQGQPSNEPASSSMDKTLNAKAASAPPRDVKEKHRWPLGVLSGGTVIDMLEYLSQTTRTPDYALALWLEKHYIKPFGRIDRMDGLIITNELHLLTLHTAYERYIEVTGERTRAQNLYVHGLEARYMPEASSFDNIPTKLPKGTKYKKWWGAEMYAQNGLEVKKKGLLVEEVWIDAKDWERKLWRAPEYQGKARRGAVKETTMKAEDKGKGTRKDSSGSEGDA